MPDQGRRELAIKAIAEAFSGVINNAGGPDRWAGEHAMEAIERALGIGLDAAVFLTAEERDTTLYALGAYLGSGVSKWREARAQSAIEALSLGRSGEAGEQTARSPAVDRAGTSPAPDHNTDVSDPLTLPPPSLPAVDRESSSDE